MKQCGQIHVQFKDGRELFGEKLVECDTIACVHPASSSPVVALGSTACAHELTLIHIEVMWGSKHLNNKKGFFSIDLFSQIRSCPTWWEMRARSVC